MVRLIHLLMPIYEKLIDQSNKRASSTISVDIVLVFPMIASNGVVVTAPLFNPTKTPYSSRAIASTAVTRLDGQKRRDAAALYMPKNVARVLKPQRSSCFENRR